MMIWPKAFWQGAAGRAVKTSIQMFVAALFVAGIVTVITPAAALLLPWATAAMTAGLARYLPSWGRFAA